MKRTPAELDVSDLPPGHGFQIELKLTDTTGNKSKPMIESLSLSFESHFQHPGFMHGALPAARQDQKPSAIFEA